ncbi:MAGE homology domain-containing protein [Elsinoe ampelina]|uniref:MAGE homology domain-containing protein n=1 Tax=Elsinoe ampelina TaxID=302913 RepID=A0A6A6GJZ1_9PEZI|nr:MAGE homology domain-containing protein [Elsinoe ampelina]
MVKNLVRMALACEYSRIPLKRLDIKEKVLGGHTKQFKVVFAAAQQHLKETFGMAMVELPVREKVTARERQAAAMAEMQAEQRRAETQTRKKPGRKSQADTQGTQSQSGQKRAWILTTILPDEYRTPDILPPPSAPTTESESRYTALSSLVVSLIMLSGGSLAETKLKRYLERANIDEMTALSNSIAFGIVDTSEKLFKKMEKDAFIMHVKDNSSGDEVSEYIVGPRGKVEIGADGVAGLVREVYGEADDPEDLERRLKRSLQAAAAKSGVEKEAIA